MSDTALKVVPTSPDILLGYDRAIAARDDGDPVLIAPTEAEFIALHDRYNLPAIYPLEGKWLTSHGQLVEGMELVILPSPPAYRIEAAKACESYAARFIRLTQEETGHEDLAGFVCAHGVDDAGSKLYDLAFSHGSDYLYQQEEIDRAAIIPLEGQPIPQADYPIDALGPIMGDIARSIVDNVQVSTPLAAQSVLAAASLAAQQFADIEPPYFGAKPIPCSNYFLTIAESGERKSATNNVALAPFNEWQRHLGEIYEHEIDNYRMSKSVYDKMVAKAETKAKTLQEARQLIENIGDVPCQPLNPSIVLNEPTIEGFLKSANHSQAGRAIITDEAGAILGGHSMTAEKKQYTFTMLSKLWDAADIVIVRVGRDTPPIRNKRLTMHLMGQGVVVNPLLSDPLANGQGFLARFLTVSAAPKAGFRTLKTKATPEEYQALTAWKSHIRSILSERNATMQSGTKNELKPALLTLDDDAFKEWRGFYDEVEKAQRPDGKYTDIKPFASKAAEHALRLAGIFTVIEQSERTRTINGDTMERAVELIRFYADEHLRLVTWCSADPHLSAAAQLIEWIKANRGSYVYKNDLRQKGPNALRKNLENSLSTLCEHGHIKLISPRLIDGAIRQNCYEVIA